MQSGTLFGPLPRTRGWRFALVPMIVSIINYFCTDGKRTAARKTNAWISIVPRTISHRFDRQQVPAKPGQVGENAIYHRGKKFRNGWKFPEGRTLDRAGELPEVWIMGYFLMEPYVIPQGKKFNNRCSSSAPGHGQLFPGIFSARD